jgi:hypothetical protein
VQSLLAWVRLRRHDHRRRVHGIAERIRVEAFASFRTLRGRRRVRRGDRQRGLLSGQLGSISLQISRWRRGNGLRQSGGGVRDFDDLRRGLR